MGDFTLARPKAGVRNKALIECETNTGVIKQTKLMYLLLPKCIQKRPENVDDTIPIEDILDDMSTDDYDKLALHLGKLLSDEFETDEKKTSTNLN